jgi:hypothetical protein
MQASLEFPEGRPFFIWKLSGLLSADAVFDAYQQRPTHPKWSYELDQLVDLTDALLGEMTAEESARYIEMVTAEQTQTGQYARRSALVIADPMQMAIGLFHESFANKRMKSSERVFTDWDDAVAWLMTERDTSKPAAET